ncbi:MAG: ABC transporter permease [Aquiluna sp.]|nr:ABC transporter permease [Aquiluna sp.]MCF8545250.1 ABC transporter permease [Aquiluna sp.]
MNFKLEDTEDKSLIAVRSKVKRDAAREYAKVVSSSITNTLISLGVVVVLWVFALWAFHVTPYIGKTPMDVFNWMFLIESASENRALVWEALGQTMFDASIGFGFGLFFATLISVIFALSKSAESALMPIAMLLRSVPLIAMAPILILVFGRAQVTVAVMGAIVVLFPALVNIVFGLRSASQAMLDVSTVYGANKLAALRYVAFPSSLPSFFAAVKISVPGAITGALLVEWLATGSGIGYGIISAVGRAKTNEVWAYVVVITLVSIILYNLVGLLENYVLRRFSPQVWKSR